MRNYGDPVTVYYPGDNRRQMYDPNLPKLVDVQGDAICKLWEHIAKLERAVYDAPPKKWWQIWK